MPPPRTRTQSIAEFQSRPHFEALDGLRGVAICLVLLHHSYRSGRFFPDVLLSNARHGVSLFFVLSGFLIATLFIRERQRYGRVSLRRFYARRALRLWPLYYLVLGVYAALVFYAHQFSPANRELFWTKLPGYLFYYTNWLPTASTGPFFQAWSLAAEEQFYLVISVAFAVCRLPTVAVIAIAAGALKFVVFTIHPAIDLQVTAARVLLSFQEPILFGVVLAIVLSHPIGYAVVRRGAASPWLPEVVGALLITFFAFWPIGARSSWDAEILYLLMAGVVAFSVVRVQAGLLAGAVLRFLGRVSYSIYLFHMLTIDAADKYFGGYPAWGRFSIAVALDIGGAWLAYRWIERPISLYYKSRFAPAVCEPARVNRAGMAVTLLSASDVTAVVSEAVRPSTAL